MLCPCNYNKRQYGFNKSEEEDENEEKDNVTTLLSSSSSHMTTVRRGEGGRNHTRTSKDEVYHQPTWTPRAAERRKTMKHHRPLLQ